MNRAKILRLAGREMDMAIAETCFGWTNIANIPDSNESDAYGSPPDGLFDYLTGLRGSPLDPLPRFSTCRADATIVEKYIKQKFSAYNFDIFDGDQEFTSKIKITLSGFVVDEIETLSYPLALCQAALIIEHCHTWENVQHGDSWLYLPSFNGKTL